MRTVLKIVLFAILLFFGITVVKRISQRGVEAEHFDKTLSNLEKNSIALIGSSRIRRGINPSILEKHFKNYHAHNLGISGGTFLTNYILADYILTETKAQILFVELSPIKADFTPFSSRLFNQLDISLSRSLDEIKIESWSANIRLYLEVYNSQFVNMLSLNEIVKSLHGNNQNFETFGFLKNDDSDVVDSSSILKFNELSVNKPKYNLKQYEQMINALTTKANSYEKKIMFLIPLTFRKDEEKDIVIPLYLTIANEHRVVLDSALIDHISDKKYLLNVNHFNSDGAAIYTEEIVRLIKKQNLIPPLNP